MLTISPNLIPYILIDILYTTGPNCVYWFVLWICVNCRTVKAVSEDGTCVGTIVCKMEGGEETVRKGYIAMLAVEENHRRIGIGLSRSILINFYLT